MPKTMSTRRFITASVCCLLAAPALAQNLVVNPGFSTDLTAWELNAGFNLSQVWSPLDALGSASSGSLYGTLPPESTFRAPGHASQCVLLNANRDYVFGAKVLLPVATTPGDSRSSVSVEAYAGENCSGSLTGVFYSPEVMTPGAWLPSNSAFHSGPGTVSARIILHVNAPNKTLLRSHFDDVFLMQPLVIFDAGFESLVAQHSD